MLSRARRVRLTPSTQVQHYAFMYMRRMLLQYLSTQTFYNTRRTESLAGQLAFNQLT